MLRRISKSIIKPYKFLAVKPTALESTKLHFQALNRFATNEPPEGFEKFLRKKTNRPSTPPVNKEKKVEGQKIDTEEEVSKQKEEIKQTSEKKNERSKKEEARSVEEEDKRKTSTDKKEIREEQEEFIENEDEKVKKPKSETENTFNSFFDKLRGKKSEENNKGSDQNPKTPFSFDRKHLIILSAVGLIFAQTFYEELSDKNIISQIEFNKDYLESDKVEKIRIRRTNDGSVYKTVAVIDLVGGGERTLILGNVDSFMENLEKQQLELGKTKDRLIPVEFEYRADANKVLDKVVSFVYLVVTIAIAANLFRQLKSGFGGMGRGGMGGGGGSDIFGLGKSQVKIYGLENKVKTRFKDVAGLDEAKVEITEFVDFLKKPKRYKEIGAKIPRGALLAGPPGTGKTLLAKAAAGEAGVPFLYISGSDFVEMFVGVGASRVRDLFKKAKEHAPSIIFIDEIDAVGRKRENKVGGNDERDNTLNQLLVEMDGFGTDSNVVVLAATNRKELLDPALTRPGRFDRSIEVTLPDIEGRKQVFLVHLKPLKLDPSKTTEEYARRLATLTPGFSGADISNLCNEAAILAARKGKKYVSAEEFESASERVIAGLEKKRIVSEEERRTVAVHESGHAVVSWFLEGGTPLLKLTIIPRSKGSLGFAQYLPNESSLETKEELMDRIACILGGRCSEELFNGKVTTGAYDDLQKAYKIADAMISKFGMSDKIGNIGYADEDYYRKHSDYMATEIDREIKNIIDQCTEVSRATVRKYKTEIEKLSEALLEKETLDLQTIVNILGERPFPPKSNFKAFLEYKKQDAEEAKEAEQANTISEEENKVQEEEKAPSGEKTETN